MSGRAGAPRWVLAALLAATAAVHVVVALRQWPSVTGVLGLVLAAAAIVVALLVPMGRRQADLVAAIVVGAVGVAAFLVPSLVNLAGGDSPTTVLDGWSVGGFLLDTVVVRTAGLTLRREAHTGAQPPS